MKKRARKKPDRTKKGPEKKKKKTIQRCKEIRKTVQSKRETRGCALPGKDGRFDLVEGGGGMYEGVYRLRKGGQTKGKATRLIILAKGQIYLRQTEGGGSSHSVRRKVT